MTIVSPDSMFYRSKYPKILATPKYSIKVCSVPFAIKVPCAKGMILGVIPLTFIGKLMSVDSRTLFAQ